MKYAKRKPIGALSDSTAALSTRSSECAGIVADALASTAAGEGVSRRRDFVA